MYAMPIGVSLQLVFISKGTVHSPTEKFQYKILPEVIINSTVWMNLMTKNVRNNNMILGIGGVDKIKFVQV